MVIALFMSVLSVFWDLFALYWARLHGVFDPELAQRGRCNDDDFGHVKGVQ